MDNHSPHTPDRATDDPSSVLGTQPRIAVRGLRKTYRLGQVDVPVLHGVDLTINPGEWVAVLGASGSGKSTLLHLMGGLDRPDRTKSGDAPCLISFDGQDINRMGRAGLDRYRARSVGFVFQFYHLLPELTVLENVTVGAMVRYGRLGYAAKRGEVVARAERLLGAFGLSARMKHRPSELSGGERQRVAIARALINEPRLLLADEPTGNLDRETGGRILETMAGLREDLGLTVVMVTHDESVAAQADRVVRLVDGRVVASVARPATGVIEPTSTHRPREVG